MINLKFSRTLSPFTISSSSSITLLVCVNGYNFQIDKKFHITPMLIQNTKSNANRQAKIFQKLLGTRKSGSKNRWIPSDNDYMKQSTVPTSIVASPSNLSKTKYEGKSANRRVVVLNKLFMNYITDLMATGQASNEIVGNGIQISRVKITPDFHVINVYWICHGNENDIKIEKILNKNAGIIRHELSQLKLMGEVPRIHFVKDKSVAVLQDVEMILKKCDFGTENDDDVKYDICKQTMNELNLESCEYAVTKHERTENKEQSNEDKEREEAEIYNEPLPIMRHDILGLNHKDIMNKILTKMKKSKQAWELYEQNNDGEQNSQPIMKSPGKELEMIQQKLETIKFKDDEFNKFLMRQKYKKNTPDRKKYSKYDDDTSFFDNRMEMDDSKMHRKEEDDYIEEEYPPK